MKKQKSKPINIWHSVTKRTFPRAQLSSDL